MKSKCGKNNEAVNRVNKNIKETRTQRGMIAPLLQMFKLFTKLTPTVNFLSRHKKLIRHIHFYASLKFS